MSMHKIIVIYYSEGRTKKHKEQHVQSDQCSTKRIETCVSGMC
jgi:hypothetical protein